ncbi:MAG: Kae1-associated serine/threonine protein kinase [Nanoarchaeota archaeon]|nr:Kae1-associated serine/threonine protein kinase [Nanoarchaeota archaeon]MBU4352305.1 Kae1-associated serine/threonine protein kinase [Nanoarchaeota archaeon]MBU4456736.1 Kae1-associated serine/threonine protein kinase [Nanoarchaeota archaeon]MCG2719168.1 Kae1-associated serine/threonine protein kinase [Nanoarchaeota archaeon]
MKKIAQGAEAIIWLKDNKIIKERIEKKYRHIDIDKRIRQKTTRFEARLLEKAREIIPVPKVLKSCDKAMIIEMEFIEGKKLRDEIDKMSSKERQDIFQRVGKKVAKLHNNNIIHGDLTTSNMLIREKIYFIDFGLGFISQKVEDKAVDLHLLHRALESKHYKHFEELFNAVMEGYKEEIKDFKEIEKRLEKVKKRGRYKNKKPKKQD